MAKTDSPWEDEHIDRLRALWMQQPQLSAAEIARRLHRSKNSVCGKANRLGLPSRPSPIRHGAGKPGVVHQLRKGDPTLPPLPRVRKPPVKVAKPAAPPPKPTKIMPKIIPAAPVKLPAVVSPKAVGCVYPLWPDQGRPTHRYCDQPVQPEKGYCPRHQKLCYTRDRWLLGASKVSDETARL